MTDRKWQEETVQPAPMPRAPTADERLEKAVRRGPWRSLLFAAGGLLLVAGLTAGPYYALRTQATQHEVQSQKEARSKAGALANRVASQYAQVPVIMKKVMTDMEPMPADKDKLAQLAGRVQGEASTAAAFYDSAHAGALQLVQGDRISLPDALFERIFRSGDKTVISFFEAAGDRFRARLGGGADDRAARTRMSAALAEIDRRDADLQDWILSVNKID